MNILQIGTIDKAGGAASISWTIKKSLEILGHNMPMFVSSKYSNDQNVKIIPRTLHRYFSFILANDIDIFKTDWILKTEEFKNADIIHLHNLHGWFFNLKTLEKMCKLKPVIWTLHDMWAITPHCACSFDGELKNGFYQCPSLDLYPRILWHNEKYLMWRKRKIYENSKINIVVPSLWLGNKVENSVLKDKNKYLIYNGINTDIFKRTDKQIVRKELNIGKDKKILLFISDGGKDNKNKGWSHIEKLLIKYKNSNGIHFICIGNILNPENEIHSNITFIPKINDSKLLAKYYSSADIFVYPSLADSFGLVVAESMSCGTPILTFETGGIPEIVEHKKNGYIAKYKDQEDLERGLEYLLKLSEQDISKMSENSIQKVKENFTEEIMIKNYVKLYNELLKK